MSSTTSPDDNASTDVDAVNLVRLIVTHDPDAVPLLKHAQERSQQSKLVDDYGFWCYKAPNSPHSCDCLYILEFFPFILNKDVDQQLFDNMCKHLQGGKCVHLLEQEQQSTPTHNCRLFAGTTLLHVAAAAGNEEVVEYLAKSFPEFIFRPSSTGIRPLHLALLKSQENVLKYLHREQIDEPNYDNFLFNRMELATRDVRTGVLSWFPCPVHTSVPNLPYIITVYNLEDPRLVAQAVTMFDQHHTSVLTNTLTFLLRNDQERVAVSILSNPYVDTTELLEYEDNCEFLVLICSLTDSETFLQELIRQGVCPIFELWNYNMLDIALAFGSENTSCILKQYMEATPGVYATISPFRLLINVDYFYPDNVITMEILRKCQDQGFDINCLDEQSGYSLPMLAIQKDCNAHTLHLLLEAGCIVDSTICKKSLLQLALSPTLNKCGVSSYRKINVLKTILQHNPSHSKSGTDLNLAVLYDLNNTPVWENIKQVLLDPIHLNFDGINRAREEQLLSVSTFAMLYELGFPITNSCLEYAKKNSTKGEKSLTFYTCMMVLTSRPRSLKSSCRIALRRAFPGKKLRKYFRATVLPHSVVEYVWSPSFLRSK